MTTERNYRGYIIRTVKASGRNFYDVERPGFGYIATYENSLAVAKAEVDADIDN